MGEAQSREKIGVLLGQASTEVAALKHGDAERKEGYQVMHHTPWVASCSTLGPDAPICVGPACRAADGRADVARDVAAARTGGDARGGRGAAAAGCVAHVAARGVRARDSPRPARLRVRAAAPRPGQPLLPGCGTLPKSPSLQCRKRIASEQQLRQCKQCKQEQNGLEHTQTLFVCAQRVPRIDCRLTWCIGALLQTVQEYLAEMNFVAGMQGGELASFCGVGGSKRACMDSWLLTFCDGVQGREVKLLGRISCE